jgi:hypothetical protein
MTLYCIAALMSGLFVYPATAEPDKGEAQPDRLALGRVYVGATVEASFLVRVRGANADIKLEVNAPKFVKVLSRSTEVQKRGSDKIDFVVGTVAITIDTTTPGEFSGVVSVTLGQTIAKVPVSVSVKDRRLGLKRILIVGTPFEAWTTNDGTVFQTWTDLVKESQLDVHYLLVERGKSVLRELRLERFDCVFLTDEALVFEKPEDIKRTRAYAEQGGRVVVAANHSITGSVEHANVVLAGYGLQIRDEEAQVGQNDVTIRRDGLDPRLVKQGVQSLHFFRASPIAVTDANKTRILVRAVGVGEPGNGFVASAQAGKGEVIAIGDALWWRWISKEQAARTDNAKLLGWLLARPRGG